MVSGGVVSLVFSAKLIFCTESGRSLADGDRAGGLLARLTGDTDNNNQPARRQQYAQVSFSSHTQIYFILHTVLHYYIFY